MKTSLGHSVPRREGADKLTGAALYVNDLPAEGVWVGGTVRSLEAHARLDGIELNSSFDWTRVVVATAKDIPGDNVVALLEDDQPVLADARILHREEPVALVAAPDPDTLRDALDAIRLRTTPIEPVFDSVASLEAGRSGEGTILFGSDNVFKRIEILRGNPTKALASADVTVRGEYTFGSQEHVYIEPQGVQVHWDDTSVVIQGSLQCPYYVVAGLARVFGLEARDVRVIQTTTGGGFGGKEEYPTLLAAHAALLAKKAGRPVRMVYDRHEDMCATTKRHPGRVRHRTGLTREGRLVAMEIDVLFDGGAYCTLSPVVLSRGAIHAAGPYACENVCTIAHVVATNHPPFGAFRGFGAPQTLFALEAHIEECASAVGLDGVEFRRRNLIGEEGVLATGQRVGKDVWVREAMECALRESKYESRRVEFDEFNAKAARDSDSIRRGIGLATFHHGAGFTGSGEVTLASKAGLRANEDGTVTVLSAQTEIGQGTRTILAQAAAEGLGVGVDLVRTEDPDTAVMPNSGPTVASRTGMVVGGLLIRAGQELRRQLESEFGDLSDESAIRRAIASKVASTSSPFEVVLQYEAPSGMEWDDATYRGDAYASYSWACYVAAVEVDLTTHEVRVLDFTAVQEIGRVMNQVLAEGQIEGGVAQGVGWALLENVVWKDGAMANPTMTDYIVPTAPDTPPIRVVLLEHPHTRAPHGAKGIGELPMDGPAPAIANALRQALETTIRHVPATPESLLEKLESKT